MDNYLRLWQEKWWAWFVGHARRPHALWWLAAVSFADAIFFPVAPEVFLVALMLAHPERWRQYLPVAFLSSVAGASVGYLIAHTLFYQFGGPLLQWYGLQHAFASAQHLLRAHVFTIMAAGNFSPVPDKVFIYAGGFLGVKFIPFILGYALGRGARMTLFVFLTEKFGAEVLTLIKRYLIWFSVLLVVLAIIYGMVHWHLLGL